MSFFGKNKQKRMPPRLAPSTCRGCTNILWWGLSMEQVDYKTYNKIHGPL